MQPERQENLFFGLSIINGTDKFYRFMNTCLAVLLLSIALSCSANNAAKTTSLQNDKPDGLTPRADVPNKNISVNQERSKATVVKNGNSKTLDCNDPNGYSLVEVDNPNREHEGDFVPKDVNVVVDGTVVAKIELPNGSDVKNFSLNSIQKTKEGFKMEADWGGWEHHYELTYYFICKERNFFFYNIKVNRIAGKDPGDVKNWEMKELKIEPYLPIEKFSILDYLGNK